MHPEVVQDQPGSCPKCGMNLVPREAGPADEHEHTQEHQNADMDHGDMDFMSMVEVTKDLPRSPDGLPMDWIEVPFGPFFPGLPGGLLLTLTLDGDGIAKTRAQSLVGGSGALPASGMGAMDFVDHLGAMDPLAPVGYRLLACRALETAAGQIPDEKILRGRIAAVERERIASHLGWLALFAQQIGFDWLLRRAASLQLQFLHANIKQVVALNPALQALIKRVQRTPLLKSRTAGIGRMAPDPALRGPLARATGIGDDARSRDKTCFVLGFTAVSRDGGDALARLHVRLDETRHSLALIKAAGVIVPPAPIHIGETSGAGEAVVETPRGMARLQLTLDNGRVTEARLDTPSTHHLDRVAQLLEQQELGDGLTTVASLDLSPWEVVQ
jgi:Ni,Fe-hydrogenase III large subunit